MLKQNQQKSKQSKQGGFLGFLNNFKSQPSISGDDEQEKIVEKKNEKEEVKVNEKDLAPIQLLPTDVVAYSLAPFLTIKEEENLGRTCKSIRKDLDVLWEKRSEALDVGGEYKNKKFFSGKIKYIEVNKNNLSKKMLYFFGKLPVKQVKLGSVEKGVSGCLLALEPVIDSKLNFGEKIIEITGNMLKHNTTEKELTSGSFVKDASPIKFYTNQNDAEKAKGENNYKRSEEDENLKYMYGVSTSGPALFSGKIKNPVTFFQKNVLEVANSLGKMNKKGKLKGVKGVTAIKLGDVKVSKDLTDIKLVRSPYDLG